MEHKKWHSSICMSLYKSALSAGTLLDGLEYDRNNMLWGKA